MTPVAVEILDTGKGKKAVADDLEAILRKIEYWHQGSIPRFRISYRSPQGAKRSVEWDGNVAESSDFTLRASLIRSGRLYLMVLGIGS